MQAVSNVSCAKNMWFENHMMGKNLQRPANACETQGGDMSHPPTIS